MILGVHGLLFSSDPDGVRAFLRDKLKLPYSDTGEGWLIFDLPGGEVGVHPVGAEGGPVSGTHDVSFYCDRIHETVAELRARGVVFDEPVVEREYGFVTHFTMPGGVIVQLYEPKYRKRRSRSPPRSRVARPHAGRAGERAKQRPS